MRGKETTGQIWDVLIVHHAGKGEATDVIPPSWYHLAKHLPSGSKLGSIPGPAPHIRLDQGSTKLSVERMLHFLDQPRS